MGTHPCSKPERASFPRVPVSLATYQHCFHLQQLSCLCSRLHSQLQSVSSLSTTSSDSSWALIFFPLCCQTSHPSPPLHSHSIPVSAFSKGGYQEGQGVVGKGTAHYNVQRSLDALYTSHSKRKTWATSCVYLFVNKQ